MAYIPCFDTAQLEAACKVLADTTNGLKGDEIGHILADMGLADPDAGITKWKRLFNALVHAQNKHQAGNHLIMFINRAMAPARYISTPVLFDWRRDGLNVALAFAGYAVRDDGKVVHTTRETTLSGALARASRLRSLLESRSTHPEVFKYCRAELLEENYFHAVLEAVKGIAERIRQLSGLSTDGAELVKAPRLPLSQLARGMFLCLLKFHLYPELLHAVSSAQLSAQADAEETFVALFGYISGRRGLAVTWT